MKTLFRIRFFSPQSANLKSEIKKRPRGRKLVGIVTIVVALAVCGVSVEAQQPGKIVRIGYLSTSNPSRDAAASKAIRQALRELGYIEGQNVAFEYRYAEGKPNRYPDLVAQLLRLKVDIILVAGGTVMIRAAKNATETIPIVMLGAPPDPVGEGLVDSLARPGGNVTGFTNLSRDLGGKRLELFKEAFSKLTRIAVLHAPASPGSARYVKEDLTVAAQALGLTLRPWEIRVADDFERVFAAIKEQRPDGLFLTPDALITSHHKQTIRFGFESRLPAMFAHSDFVEAGGLMSYAADQKDSWKRAADLVDKILKGTKPAVIPVEQPTKFEFVINLKTAKQIGQAIAPNVLARADRVIR